MGFLDILGLKKIADDLSEPTYPPVVPQPRNESEDTDYYRVGITNEGDTTLTIRNNNFGSITLTMNRDSCEQLIKMLQSTFKTESNNETTNS